MPDLTKWVRCDGKIYCWDKAAKKVVDVRITDIPFDQVPKDVFAAMINNTAADWEKSE